MTARTHYEALAARWVTSGRNPELLLRGRDFLAMSCWISSDGAKSEGVNLLLRQYARACEKLADSQSRDWFDELLRQRCHCDRCGESLPLETLTLCTQCGCTYCPGCARQFVEGPNGNRLHTCGGELVE